MPVSWVNQHHWHPLQAVLLQATKSGDVETVQRCLGGGVCVNCRGKVSMATDVLGSEGWPYSCMVRTLAISEAVTYSCWGDVKAGCRNVENSVHCSGAHWRVDGCNVTLAG
jgi:ferredoxin